MPMTLVQHLPPTIRFLVIGVNAFQFIFLQRDFDWPINVHKAIDKAQISALSSVRCTSKQMGIFAPDPYRGSRCPS